MKNILKPSGRSISIPSKLTAAASAANVAIQKKKSYCVWQYR